MLNTHYIICFSTIQCWRRLHDRFNRFEVSFYKISSILQNWNHNIHVEVQKLVKRTWLKYGVLQFSNVPIILTLKLHCIERLDFQRPVQRWINSCVPLAVKKTVSCLQRPYETSGSTQDTIFWIILDNCKTTQNFR